MIRKITLQNFMAHRLTVIEPAEGLTVLAGPNNCGKSAVVEALQVLAGNTGKDFMVRHGETECRIAVETSEGDEIVWRRKGAGGGVTSYAVNGREIHRVKGSVPEEVAEKLRLKEVEGPEGKERFAVHFGLQKEPIFLLDESGRNTATFFAAFSDAGRLMEMQQLHKGKVAEARREEKSLVEREGELSGRVESLLPVEELMGRLERVEWEFAGVMKEMGAVEEMERRVEGLMEKGELVEEMEARRGVLGRLAGVPEMEEVRGLEAVCGRMGRVMGERSVAEARVKVTEAMPGVPVVEEVVSLARVIGEMRRRGAEMERALGRVRVEVPGVPEVLEVAGLERVVAGVRGAEGEVGRCGAELKKAEGAVAEVRGEMEKWVVVHPVCPTCGAAMDVGKLMGGAGGGHGHG